MRTVETKLYTLSELSERSKEAAYDSWLEYSESPSCDEAFDTMKAFCELFNMKALSLDIEHGYYKVTWNSDLEDIKGKHTYRYMRKIWDDLLKPVKYYATSVKKKLLVIVSKINMQVDCSLTGVCYDYDILEGIERFLKKPYTDDVSVNDVIRDCLESFVRVMSDIHETERSFEYFQDEADNNNYEFYENGERF